MADETGRHERHDVELVALFAAADATPVETERAQRLIEDCAECAALVRDLRDIAAAVQGLPSAATMAASVKAPRDFRLTADQAARLRPAGLVSRLTAGVLGGVAAFGRPVGATLATFGLVGLLVGSMALSPTAGTPAAVPLATTAPAEPGFEAAGNGPAQTAEIDRSQPGPVASEATDGSTRITTAGDGRPDPALVAWLFAGSITLLVLGVALLLAGFRGRPRSRSPGR